MFPFLYQLYCRAFSAHCFFGDVDYHKRFTALLFYAVVWLPILFTGLLDRVFMHSGLLVFHDLPDPLCLILQSKSDRLLGSVHIRAVRHISGEMYRVEFTSRCAESAAYTHVGIDRSSAALETA